LKQIFSFIIWDISIFSLILSFSKDVYSETSFEKARRLMIAYQLKGRGIHDAKVLKSFSKAPRELFIRKSWESSAYDDNPLPIGEGQTISQPYVVALMTEALKLKENDKVLEIGTGSGYQAAILSEITKRVYSIEIRASLSQFAKTNLKKAGYTNVKVKTADGYDGWTEYSPYDAIMITAAANHIPPPLKKQLKIGGRLILPLGSTVYYQSLVLVTRRSEHQFDSKVLTDVRFVPMIGKAKMQAPPKDNNPKKLKKPK
jgi:protein-L-isoaspartate(D-aspartate) O-methyltransferase